MKEKIENKKIVHPLIMTTIVALVVAALSFFGGMKYQQSKTPAFGNGRFVGNGQMRNGVLGGNRVGFRPVSGSVLSVDDKSMTVKLNDGSTKIVLLSATTTYSKSNSGTQSDVTAGSTVAVFGTENSDGSVTAQNVQLNPVMRTTGEGAQGSPIASPAAKY